MVMARDDTNPAAARATTTFIIRRSLGWSSPTWRRAKCLLSQFSCGQQWGGAPCSGRRHRLSSVTITDNHRPQSSSASHFTAGAAEFLELEPVRRPFRPVTRSQALRHNPLGTELASVLEYQGALGMLQVLVQAHAVAALVQDARQRRLAHLDGSRRRSVPFSSSRSKA
jgi:hypothetical protein